MLAGEISQTLKRKSDLGMFWSQDMLAENQSTLIQRFCLGIFSLFEIKSSKIVEDCNAEKIVPARNMRCAATGKVIIFVNYLMLPSGPY